MMKWKTRLLFKVKYRVQGNQVQCKLPKPLSADVLEQVEAKRAIWMDPVETKKAPYGAATAGVNKAGFGFIFFHNIVVEQMFFLWERFTLGYFSQISPLGKKRRKAKGG